MRRETARPAPVSQIIGSPLRKTNSERWAATGRAADAGAAWEEERSAPSDHRVLPAQALAQDLRQRVDEERQEEEEKGREEEDAEKRPALRRFGDFDGGCSRRGSACR